MQMWHQTVPHPLHRPNSPQLLHRRRSRQSARLHGPGKNTLKSCWQSGMLGGILEHQIGDVWQKIQSAIHVDIR